MSFVAEALSNVELGSLIHVLCADGKIYAGTLMNKSIYHVELIDARIEIGYQETILEHAKIILNRSQIIAVAVK